MFETNKIHASNSKFLRLVTLVEQRTDKSLWGEGVGGYTLENFFAADLHELEKQPETKVGGGQLAPLAPYPGGATRLTGNTSTTKSGKACKSGCFSLFFMPLFFSCCFVS